MRNRLYFAFIIIFLSLCGCATNNISPSGPGNNTSGTPSTISPKTEIKDTLSKSINQNKSDEGLPGDIPICLDGQIRKFWPAGKLSQQFVYYKIDYPQSDYQNVLDCYKNQMEVNGWRKVYFKDISFHPILENNLFFDKGNRRCAIFFYETPEDEINFRIEINPVGWDIVKTSDSEYDFDLPLADDRIATTHIHYTHSEHCTGSNYYTLLPEDFVTNYYVDRMIENGWKIEREMNFPNLTFIKSGREAIITIGKFDNEDFIHVSISDCR